MAQHLFIQGPLGSGKTFLMSLLAHHWREKVLARGGDIRLFSNYGLKDAQPMDHYSDWYDVARVQGSICCWDEAQMAFDSRQALKSSSIYASQLMMFTRKMKSVQIYCSPSINNVDSRIRQIVEVLINVRKIGNKGFSIMFTDFQTGEFMHKQFLPMWKAKMIFKMQLYDTYQMVSGFPLPNTEREAIKFFDELDQAHNEGRRVKERVTVGS
ncbi:ATPase [Desertibacillus haloalkaliphilus]|uniref:ATPase n=1 Tax=Desertibacillus haloalkaliphilus TaxID=1328930 RepID=UPI001C25375B|nr:ATPase [Desertibacillus haloalkaliphilus]MBU8905583.1 ATPase [Desertibacillus haloalkaliphilus]